MLVNSKKMLLDAKEKNYAIAQFNINNLEWAKYILEVVKEKKVPVILGVSEGALKYMGGFSTVVGMVKGLVTDLGITTDVVLHLDHGKSFEICKQAIDAGFTSVMIDGSAYLLEENIKLTKQVVEYAHARGVTVEGEVGRIQGTEEESVKEENHAKVEDCIKLYKGTNIDSLAPALGSVHGWYQRPIHLDFETMKKLREELPIPLVLHGGTGIKEEQLKKAIECGITKININTELQIAWHSSVLTFIEQNPNNYDPRKVIGSGKTAMKEKIEEKINLFQIGNYHISKKR